MLSRSGPTISETVFTRRQSYKHSTPEERLAIAARIRRGDRFEVIARHFRRGQGLVSKVAADSGLSRDDSAAARANSKMWVVVSPRGKLYKVFNLRAWCRQHAHRFAPYDWPVAYAGMMQVAASLRGNRSVVTAWRDWAIRPL